MITLASKVVTLKAGQVLPIAATASVFSCSNATATFNVSVDGGAFIPMQAGWSVDVRPKFFTELVLQNPNPVAITVAFYATTCAINFGTNFNPATYAKGSGVLTLNAYNTTGDRVTFNGLDGINVRKQIIINMLSAGAVAYIQDPNGNWMCGVAYGMLWTVEMGGALTIVNSAAGPISIIVGEIFYAS